MKGIVFTELVGFVERHASIPVAESIISGAALDNDGAFTSVGNYPHSEAIKLVLSASEELDIPPADLMRQFGNELFPRLLDAHPQFIGEEPDDAFTFLSKVQTHIHVEVAKLYTDSNPPAVRTTLQDGEMIVSYSSHRPFAMIAMGLIEGCCAYFDDTLVVELHEDLDPASKRATFSITRKGTA
jgi:hypothetical protein